MMLRAGEQTSAESVLYPRNDVVYWCARREHGGHPLGLQHLNISVWNDATTEHGKVASATLV